MKKFKRFMRLCSLALFLILALTGIAVTGAAPIPSKKREDFLDTEVLIEMADRQKDAKMCRMCYFKRPADCRDH